MNPHKLRNGATFWTNCPFEAMSMAAKTGARVDRYYSGQHLPGMIIEPERKSFGYGITRGDGFELFNRHTGELCNAAGHTVRA